MIFKWYYTTILQPKQVKHTTLEYINEMIIWKLNPS